MRSRSIGRLGTSIGTCPVRIFATITFCSTSRPIKSSIGHISRSQRVLDNDDDYVSPLDMLAELRDDNMRIAAAMREVHGLCDEVSDIATASLLEVWIDETEKRVWYLFEASRRGDIPGR